MIHVAFGLHDKNGDYSRHLSVVIVSILKNTTQEVTFHLLHDESLTEENKNKLTLLCEKFAVNIIFHRIIVDVNTLPKNNSLKSITPAGLFRLKLPEILPNLEKVIYFDCDIICNMDISKYWNIDIKDAPFVVVKDSYTYKKIAIQNDFYRKFEIMTDKYFNSGVLVMNLNLLRNNGEDLYDECLNFLRCYPEAPCSDQDFLNYHFQDKVIFMDNKYNFIVDDAYILYGEQYMMRESWNDICWHCAGNEKPWFSKKYPIFVLYWEYLSQTPWGDTTEKLLNFMYRIEGEALDDLMLKRRIVSRKLFVKNFVIRLYNEIMNKYFR